MSEQQQPPKEAAFFTAIRQSGPTRSDHGLVGGVVEGAGASIGLAAAPSRLIVLVLGLFFPGLIMLGYAAAWGLLPDGRGNIVIQNFGRGVTNVGALLGIAVLTLFGFGALSNGPMIDPFGWGNDSWVWNNVSNGLSGGGVRGVLVMLFFAFFMLLVMAGVAALIVWLVKRSNNAASPPPAGVWNGTPTSPEVPPTSDTADARAEQAGDASQAPGEQAAASATPPTAIHQPQPWEPALLPGDPRLAGVPGAVPPPPFMNGPGVPPASAAGGAPVPPPPMPYTPPMPYSPPRPQVPGPGRGGYFSFLGVLFIAAAVVFAVERTDGLAVNAVLAWGAVVTVGLGIVLVGVALSGRKLGFLGFVSVVSVLAGVPLAANADGIRDYHASDSEWWSFDETVLEEPYVDEEFDDSYVPETDLTEPFVDDYSQVYIASGCWALSQTDNPAWESDPMMWSDAGQARIRVDELTEDTTLTVGDGATTITVPAGSNVAVPRSAAIHVVWEERDLMCDFWDENVAGKGEWLSFINPGEPVLEIAPSGDQAAIFIKEEQS